MLVLAFDPYSLSNSSLRQHMLCLRYLPKNIISDADSSGGQDYMLSWIIACREWYLTDFMIWQLEALANEGNRACINACLGQEDNVQKRLQWIHLVSTKQGLVNGQIFQLSLLRWWWELTWIGAASQARVTLELLEREATPEFVSALRMSDRTRVGVKRQRGK